VLAGPIRLDTTEIQVVRNGLYRILYREEFGRSYHYLEKYKRTTLANVGMEAFHAKIPIVERELLQIENCRLLNKN